MARILAALFLVALYGAVALGSPGFDDEYYNIGLIESTASYADVIARANTTDLHPPGQYVINRFLLDLLGDWSWARAATAVVAASTIIAVWRAAEGGGRADRVFAYVVICLSPSLLLWCTSLRWYAYFVPILNLMIVILLRNPSRPLVYWGALAAASLALFHIGYLALVIAPAAFLAALYQRRASLVGELWILGGLLAVAALLAYPQFVALVSVHIGNAAPSSWFWALSGLAIHAAGNHGAVPVSAFGLTLLVANLAIVALATVNWRTVLLRPPSLLLGLGTAGLVAAKLSGAFRNLVVLSTLQGVFQAATFAQTSSVAMRSLLMALFAVGNIGGIYNVTSHTNTMKGSWNTPYRLALDTYRARTAACGHTTVVTHDPVVAFMLRRVADQVIYVDGEGWREQLLARSAGCLVTFETFRGSLSAEARSQYEAIIRALPGKTSTDRLGLDGFAFFKRRFDPDIPDHFITLTVFRN